MESVSGEADQLPVDEEDTPQKDSKKRKAPRSSTRLAKKKSKFGA